MIRRAITVTGIVQGVGFRPFVVREARRLGLSGWVQNRAGSLEIEAEGPLDAVLELVRLLGSSGPPTAAIVDITVRPLELGSASCTFISRESDLTGSRRPVIPPDTAMCPECRRELTDPGDRRFRYPFTTCASCGPRFSIVTRIPYDRAGTTLDSFPLCEECNIEYHNDTNRRFEAQNTVCSACGPRLLGSVGRDPVSSTDAAALEAAIQTIVRGGIVLLKGIGGFQLLVDAKNDAAVRRLREKKRRSQRPFAVMFPNLSNLEAACFTTAADVAMLQSPAAPIVILKQRASSALSQEIAPNLSSVGAFLPYSPLHALLLGGLNQPLVCTSGNLSEEPLCTDDDDARARLHPVYDFVLSHNRPIARPLDDSLVRTTRLGTTVWRRARGYAPLPFPFPDGPKVLALGGHQKNTFTLAYSGQAITSQHIGDLGSLNGIRLLECSIRDYLKLYEVVPEIIVCDLHPDYATTRLGAALAAEFGVPLERVQHHYAHAAACIAEHRLRGPSLALIWDGAGYGDDGRLWGGEAFEVDDDSCSRFAHMRPFPLPGGESAMRDPRRVLLGLAFAASGPELPPEVAELFDPGELSILIPALTAGIFAETTSVGRLFDAASALCFGRRPVSYEAEAATWLEEACASSTPTAAYPITLRKGRPQVLDWEPLFWAMIEDARRGRHALIPGRFHAALVEAAVLVTTEAPESSALLSGGCFQNQWLLREVSIRLEKMGRTVYTPLAFPANDGGISLGQAYVAQTRHRNNTHVPRNSR